MAQDSKLIFRVAKIFHKSWHISLSPMFFAASMKWLTCQWVYTMVYSKKCFLAFVATITPSAKFLYRQCAEYVSSLFLHRTNSPNIFSIPNTGSTICGSVIFKIIFAAIRTRFVFIAETPAFARFVLARFATSKVFLSIPRPPIGIGQFFFTSVAVNHAMSVADN